MIKLQHFNVIRYAKNEVQAQELISKGFKVIEPEPKDKTNKEESKKGGA